MKRKRAKRVVIIAVSLLVLAGLVVFLDIPLKKTVTIPLSETQGMVIPAVFLADIETVQDLDGVEITADKDEAFDDINIVTYESSILAPVRVWMIQSSQPVESLCPMISTYYYELQTKHLRRYMIDSLIINRRILKDSLGKVLFGEDVQLLEDDRFDLLYVIRNDIRTGEHNLAIIASNDKKVLWVSYYYGFAEEDVIIDKMAEVLSAETAYCFP